MSHPHWPLFDVVVRTPRIELRHPDDDMCLELTKVAGIDMFPDGDVYFMSDWLSEESPLREQNSFKYWWSRRATWSVDDWTLVMAVIVDGHLAGVQEVGAQSFPAKRSVHTGSWLAAPFQARGVGREMREAILHLAFAGLGAKEALSEAFEGNERSIRDSRGVGYEDNGQSLGLRAGKFPAVHFGFRMSAERFAERRRDDIVIENLEPCLPMFGLAPDLKPLDPPV